MTLQNRPDVISVLGMHRSGTSFLIGSLQAAGLYLGPHNTWNAHNLKGNRENNDIVAFHEDLLNANGGTWKQPPADVVWPVDFVERARGIIAGYANAPVWGFKDPRTLIFLDGWKRLLPDIRFAGIFRHPAAVARSLAERGKGAAISVAEEQAFALWDHYNQRMLAEYRRRPFPILCFDWDADRLQKKFDEAARALGLNPPDSADPFFSPELRHHQEDAGGIAPPESLELYRTLLSIAM